MATILEPGCDTNGALLHAIRKPNTEDLCEMRSMKLYSLI
jgi:hypothetical protein